MHIHTLHTNCFDQFIDFRQIQTKTPLSSFALFRIDTSGRRVLPHSARDWSVIHGFNSCNGLKWNVYLVTSDLQISGVPPKSPWTSQFWDHSKLLWKSLLFHEIRGNQHVLRTSPGNRWAVASSKDRGDHLQYLPIASPYKTLKWQHIIINEASSIISSINLTYIYIYMYIHTSWWLVY